MIDYVNINTWERKRVSDHEMISSDIHSDIYKQNV